MFFVYLFYHMDTFEGGLEMLVASEQATCAFVIV